MRLARYDTRHGTGAKCGLGDSRGPSRRQGCTHWLVPALTFHFHTLSREYAKVELVGAKSMLAALYRDDLPKDPNAVFLTVRLRSLQAALRLTSGLELGGMVGSKRDLPAQLGQKVAR